MIGYRFGRRGETPTDPLSWRETSVKVDRALRKIGRPVQLRSRDDDTGWGAVRRPADAMDRLDRMMPRVPVGHVELIRVVGGNSSFVIRKVEWVEHVAQTNGNSKIDRIVTEVAAFARTRGDRIELQGVTVNKPIGSSATPSQHCDWPPTNDWHRDGYSSRDGSAGGNAVDIGDPQGDRHHLRAYAELVVDHADGWDAENVINWRVGRPFPEIWNRPEGWHRYVVPPGGSTHATHVHVDCRPPRGLGGERPRP